MTPSPAAELFIGVWRLESIRDRFPDGRVEDNPDFSTDPDGLLVYTASGHVSVQFMRRERAAWRNEDDHSDAERAQAARGYGAYAGRYEVDEQGGAVLHHVETALIPNRVGRTLRRRFTFSPTGDRLTLRSPAFRRGGLAVERSLVWRRVGE